MGRLLELFKRLAATALVGGYALSPIDLIPDFIPVVGQMDDLGFLLLLLYYWYSYAKQREIPENQSAEPSGPIIDIKPSE